MMENRKTDAKAPKSPTEGIGALPVSFGALLADSFRERRKRLIPAAACCVAAVCLLVVVEVAAAGATGAAGSAVSTRGFAAEVAGAGGINAAYCRALDSSFLISRGGGAAADAMPEGSQPDAGLGVGAAVVATGGDSAPGASGSAPSISAASGATATDGSSGKGTVAGATSSSASAGGSVRNAGGAEATAGASSWLTSGNYTDNVPTWSQNELGLYGGCEVVSATAMLVAAGFDVTADDVVDHLEIGADFGTHYVGDPYNSGAGYPVAIANAMNATVKWAASEGDAGETAGRSSSVASSATVSFAVDEGTPLSDLAAIANRGVPCLVWTTMYTQAPAWSGIWDGEYQWYDNEHCVVVMGGSADEGVVRVMDPVDGDVVERDWDDFEAIYEECGSMAVRAMRG